MRKMHAWFVVVLFICGSIIAKAPAKLVLHFFGSSTCGKCAEIRTALLKPLAEKYADKIEIRMHFLDDDSAFNLVVKMEEEYRVAASSPQELFFPDTVLLGYASIMKNGKSMIEYYLNHPEKWKAAAIDENTASLAHTLKERFRKYTFVQILLAGLVDGINPCAIATMIFLISFLAMQKRKRTEILVIGLTFSAAVFATYLLLGLGAFKALSMLKAYHWIASAIRWGAVAAALAVAIICFRDALVFNRTGRAKDVKIQLPAALKKQIHQVISGNLSTSSLFIGTAVTGFLVTLLEAVCTGQVYLPTIILMTRAEGLRLTGWLYLLFYNFLFVLPLLIIMVLAYYGLRWDELSRTTQKHLPLLKILMGAVLLGLAVFLAIAG
jgi:cytochrome c biogenesis protein CcdA